MRFFASRDDEGLAIWAVGDDGPPPFMSGCQWQTELSGQLIADDCDAEALLAGQIALDNNECREVEITVKVKHNESEPTTK